MRGRSLSWVKEPKNRLKECGIAGDNDSQFAPDLPSSTPCRPGKEPCPAQDVEVGILSCTLVQEKRVGTIIDSRLERHLKCDAEHPCTNCRTVQVSCEKARHKKIRFKHVFAHNRSISTPGTGRKGTVESFPNDQSISLISED